MPCVLILPADSAHHYLHNAEFVIKSDHKPLSFVLSAPLQNKKIQLWALSLAGYNCKVEYIEGKANTCADLLSRIPEIGQGRVKEEIKEPDVDVNDRMLEINAEYTLS